MKILIIMKMLNIILTNNMKTKVVILFAAAPVSSDAAVSNGPLSYLIGGIVVLLILGYLVYTLLRPEKF